MSVSKADFVREWGDALAKGQAAVFIGSGVSREVGYPSWDELMQGFARKLGLTLRRHDDLTAVAQHYLNEGGNRAAELRHAIRNAFPPTGKLPVALQVLSRLPLRSIWTTNYDRLIERAWEAEGVNLDVKRKQSDLQRATAWADATLYKMHGCMDDEESIVIAKDDYDLYAKNRDGFFTALAADLIGKRMLFLGFGHNDPNLAFIFSTLRRMFGNDAARHFSVGRKPAPQTGEEPAEVETRHRLWAKDWETRYGVRFVEVGNWGEVPSLLEEVARRAVVDSVMVSGSFPVDGDSAARGTIEQVANGVGEVLGAKRLRLVSGFGLTVGSASIAGMLQGLGGRSVNLDRHLLLRPFPQSGGAGRLDTEVIRTYRRDLVGRAGACVFVGGAKFGPDGALLDADGVVQEYEECVAMGRVPIPVGATGFAAAAIWERMQGELVRWPWYNSVLFSTLNDRSLLPEQLVTAVRCILEDHRKAANGIV